MAKPHDFFRVLADFYPILAEIRAALEARFSTKHRAKLQYNQHVFIECVSHL